MLQRSLTIILALLLLCTAKTSVSQKTSFVEVNNWLYGKWEGSDKSIQAKYMIKPQDNFIKGVGVRQSPDGSKNALEAIQIFKNGSKWILMILGAENNERKYLELREFSGRLMMFERSDKSFPKKVSFVRLDDNLIRISMEGIGSDKRLEKMELYLFRSQNFTPQNYQAQTFDDEESVKL